MARLSLLPQLLFPDRQELEHHDVGALAEKYLGDPNEAARHRVEGGRAHGGPSALSFL